MPDSPQPSLYRIDHTPQAVQQLRKLSEQATDLGFRAEFFAAMRLIVDKLKKDPITSGEPEYHTAHPGGIVCRGGCNPVFVRYAVYEQERLVIVLKLALMPGLPKA